MTTDAAETIALLFLHIFPSAVQGVSAITKINVQLWGSEFYFLSPFTNYHLFKKKLSSTSVYFYSIES